MNPELKQRLIGAVVVTALAAIFIPMLFDDPIDRSGQTVTELEIPSPASNAEETVASKLPNNAQQVLETPNSASETLINTNTETEIESETLPPSELSAEDEQLAEANNPSMPLDTGMVDEQNRIIEPKTNTPSTKPITTDLEPIVTNTPAKESVKKPVQSNPKPVVNEVIIPTPTKPKSSLSRWTLQAGSFSKKENAVALLESLKKQGLPATLDTVNGPYNSPFYRLRVGPTLDKKRALDMKAILDNQKIQSLLIAE